ncbi:UDP-xylose and UDP-N-acetylglucosamine transporter [Suricata suricatta]|uniref:UDP-xylose and UDP-N-acetylglucosamine transporter n=1 Tax=Suricata suricatta TaxID=37032 RepID=UPI0011554EFD|nr:UDP-xylose and UDP-N-acetylglucosamine transporter [Suricata suricatta]
MVELNRTSSVTQTRSSQPSALPEELLNTQIEIHCVLAEGEIKFRYYAVMVTMFFTVSVVNNYALNLNIAMPLHMIFRSGSLIANMILGIIILKKSHILSDRSPMWPVVTLVENPHTGSQKCQDSDVIEGGGVLGKVGTFSLDHVSGKFALAVKITVRAPASLSVRAPSIRTPCIGALTFALLMSARMGIFQETLYKQFGKHSKEALFYNHALPLPGFVFLASDIYDHAVLFNKSELYQVPFIGVTVPIMWFYLLMNVVTQYVCIRGVFILTTECASLTVTLVVTLRKFVSLIFSILYFQNPFTLWHWLGTLFVFIGTLMYTEVWNSLGTTKSQLQKEDKKN